MTGTVTAPVLPNKERKNEMSFLNELFRGKRGKKENAVYEALSQVHASYEARDFYSQKLEKTDLPLTFNAKDTKLFGNSKEASDAFRACLPFISGKPFPSVEIRNFDSADSPSSLMQKKMDLQMEELKFSDCCLNPKDWGYLASNLKNSGVRKLEFTFMNDNDLAFLEDLPLESLEELTISNCGLTGRDLTFIAPKIAASSLKSLDLQGNNPRGQGLTDLINALPPTLTELNLSEITLGVSEVKRLADKVKTMPNLKFLSLSECHMGSSSLDVLLPALPSSVTLFDISDNILDGDALKKLVGHLKKPGCFISDTYASGQYEMDIPDSVAEELRQAEDNNRKAFYLHKEQAKAAEIFKEPAAFKNPLHKAVAEGTIDTVFETMIKDGRTLTSADLQSVEQGKTFVEACILQRRANALMQPKLYADAKDYQNVYDALPEKEKAKFDGKDGRPSFVKMKNQIMSTAVKAAMAQKLRKVR